MKHPEMKGGKKFNGAYGGYVKPNPAAKTPVKPNLKTQNVVTEDEKNK